MRRGRTCCATHELRHLWDGETSLFGLSPNYTDAELQRRDPSPRLEGETVVGDLPPWVEAHTARTTYPEKVTLLE